MRKPFVWLSLAGLFLAGFITGAMAAEYYEDGQPPLTVLQMSLARW